MSLEAILNHNASLNIALYVSNVNNNKTNISLDDALQNWQDSSEQLSKSMQQLFNTLNE